MKKVCAKIVPKLLTAEQQLRQKECCVDWKTSEESEEFLERVITGNEFLERVITGDEFLERVITGDEFLDRVITGDESWIYEYDIELKSQSIEWKQKDSARRKKSRKSKSKIKVMLMVFFDCYGIVHHEFTPDGQTVNAASYVEVLKRLRDRVHRVRPELWEGRRWILHHDDAPAHSALIVREFLVRNSITMLEHPPYSPDLAPCDFFLFPKCKLVLWGRHLRDETTIKSETTLLLKGSREEEFQRCFQQWKQRWDKCFVSNWEYFEGDHIDVC